MRFFFTYLFDYVVNSKVYVTDKLLLYKYINWSFFADGCGRNWLEEKLQNPHNMYMHTS